MKGFAIVFFGVFAFSAVFSFLAERTPGWNRSLFSFAGYAEKDKDKIKEFINEILETSAHFDDRFYKLISGDAEESGQTALEYEPFNFDTSSFSYPSLSSMAAKTVFYFSKGMEAKARIASGKYEGEAFIGYFNGAEYNYAAGEAMIRIMEKAVREKSPRSYMSDIVTEKIIAHGPSREDAEESYERAIGWFVGHSALKSSFEVNYLEIMFGRSFFSVLELKKMIYRMDAILEAMKKNSPPEPLGQTIGRGFEASLKSYANKKALAEYVAFAVFPDEEKTARLVSRIYGGADLSQTIARKAGYDAFRTLASVTLFELYSKNYR